jgi:hypothetical protein
MHQWTNWEAEFSTRSVQQLRDATIELLEALFSMRSMPRCYKQDEIVDRVNAVQCSGASWLVSELTVLLRFISCELVAEAGDSSRTQRKGNVRCWKPLAGND